MSSAKNEGYQAFYAGSSSDDCPYEDKDSQREWLSGYLNAENDNNKDIAYQAGADSYYSGNSNEVLKQYGSNPDLLRAAVRGFNTEDSSPAF